MGKFIDMTGERYGKLTVLKRIGLNQKTQQSIWLCKCDCGKEKGIGRANLKSGQISCGCANKIKEIHELNRKRNDISGKKFGKWTAIKVEKTDNSNKNLMYFCRCDCGNEKLVARMSLVHGDSKSCGCIKHQFTPKQRIINKIEFNENGCWEWQGSLSQSGYGNFYYIDRHLPAHRASYEIFIGKIPDHLFALHKCDNRKCVNPDHIYPGTQKDNMRDCIERNRLNNPIGENHHNSKISECEVKEIRKKYLEGLTTYNDLSKHYKISPSHVARIIKGKVWKHI